MINTGELKTKWQEYQDFSRALQYVETYFDCNYCEDDIKRVIMRRMHEQERVWYWGYLYGGVHQ